MISANGQSLHVVISYFVELGRVLKHVRISNVAKTTMGIRIKNIYIYTNKS